MISHQKQAHKPKIKTLAIALFILACTATTSYAEVYKWTDKQGNTHYSDIKPNEVTSKKLNIKTNNLNQTRKSPQSSAQELDQAKARELEAKAEKLQSQTQKEAIKTYCQAIRDNLKTLQENSRVKINENETSRYMTPEEIENKKQEYQQQLNSQCAN